jgi:hypothetical protein
VLECCKFSRAALPLALVTAIAPALAEAGEALLEPGRYCVALSTNNPLVDCPAHGHSISGDTIHFEVAFKGTNAAKGSAVFQLDHNSHRGGIVMKMGGKNMTVTGHQLGRRMGPCQVSN